MDSNMIVGDPSCPIPNCPLDLLQQEIRFFGANLSSTLDPQVSHVLVHTRYVMSLYSFFYPNWTQVFLNNIWPVRILKIKERKPLI